ncbi:hypothetical protein [uncultured Psychroserpens sp.]|uniref:hypothetical protein n=1 Tax=uncultured Psychroserpens sp. TaxID=255436 RepID=UPI002603B814|nr:hypothetical protein [uncultured Psychroserpens sp.]
MNIRNNLAKSCVLAALVFWIITGLGFEESNMVLLVLVSFIPIFFIASLVILSTICSVFWITEKNGLSKTQVYKRYFPYYAIFTFGIAAFGIISTNFSIFSIAFFSSAFITTSQSWIWFAKNKQV